MTDDGQCMWGNESKVQRRKKCGKRRLERKNEQQACKASRWRFCEQERESRAGKVAEIKRVAGDALLEEFATNREYKYCLKDRRRIGKTGETPDEKRTLKWKFGKE
ncbi:hypothetical protein TRVL_02449 [Trypanosoma vivax]|nr:hypothetical protein TRVL_02449 [Trypanosoma vivax]